MTEPGQRQPPPGRGLLEGQSVVVTAAAGSGIGFATAQRCAAEGATLVLSDIHPDRLDACRTRLERETGRGAFAIRCDVTDQEQVADLFATVNEDLGGIDVVVNNAGLGGTRPLVEMTDSEWNRVLDVTLNGTFRCIREALRYMIPRNRGVIVNVASVLGWRAQAGQSHYAAAKAGVMALTRCAALEAAPAGIRVNAVAPSLAMHENLSKVTSDALLKRLAAREAFGRASEPWEVANVIVFLASDLAGYMTGEVVSVSDQHP